MKEAYFSIDDCRSIFNDLVDNHRDSIFEQKILRWLRFLHRRVGLNVVLYSFWDLAEHRTLLDVLVKYKTDFQNNADWLKIGIHCFGLNVSKEEMSQDFISRYSTVCQSVKNQLGG